MCDLLDIFQVVDFTCIAANTIEDLQYSHFSILYWHSVSRCCARLTLVTSWPQSECTQGKDRNSHTVSWACQMYTKTKDSSYGIQKVLIQVVAIWLGAINLTATLLYFTLKDKINYTNKQTNKQISSLICCYLSIPKLPFPWAAMFMIFAVDYEWLDLALYKSVDKNLNKNTKKGGRQTRTIQKSKVTFYFSGSSSVCQRAVIRRRGPYCMLQWRI